MGALLVVVAVQVSALGLNFPPVFKGIPLGILLDLRPRRSFHCRSRLPCESDRPSGALMVLVAVQLSVLGLYLPPVLKHGATSAPDNHLAASPNCRLMPSPLGRIGGGGGGCPVINAGIVSPASVRMSCGRVTPPQTIISLPVQTAVCRYRASGAL